MKTNQQDDAPRVRFERPLEVRVMAIDGTWNRESLLIDVSDTGAQIEVAGYAAELTEFFLLLTRFGSPVFLAARESGSTARGYTPAPPQQSEDDDAPGRPEDY